MNFTLTRIVRPLISKIPATNDYLIVNKLHTSLSMSLDQRWRQNNRLAMNPNVFGPLTNLPDYSYTDGRPAPFGVRQLERINKQRTYLTKIKKLVREVDYAVDRHAKLQAAQAEERSRIIANKLNPKGENLLQESSTPA